MKWRVLYGTSLSEHRYGTGTAEYSPEHALFFGRFILFPWFIPRNAVPQSWVSTSEGYRRDHRGAPGHNAFIAADLSTGEVHPNPPPKTKLPRTLNPQLTSLKSPPQPRNPKPRSPNPTPQTPIPTSSPPNPNPLPEPDNPHLKPRTPMPEPQTEHDGERGRAHQPYTLVRTPHTPFPRPTAHTSHPRPPSPDNRHQTPITQPQGVQPKTQNPHPKLYPHQGTPNTPNTVPKPKS